MINVRSSSCHPLFSGKRGGLTDKQKEKLDMLMSKEDRTLKQTEEMNGLYDRMNRVDDLSDGAKTYIEDMIDEMVYDYRVTVSTREMTKGTMVEDESINVYNRVMFTDYEKLTPVDEYGFLSYGISTGHPDIVDHSLRKVIDIKSPWSKKTMPKNLIKATKKVKESGYDWQVKHYLYMLEKTTGQKWRHGEVAFVLSNTPEELIPDNESDVLHYMDELSDNLRVTIVSIDLTDDEIVWMDNQLKLAEEYASKYFNYLNNKNK